MIARAISHSKAAIEARLYKFLISNWPLTGVRKKCAFKRIRAYMRRLVLPRGVLNAEREYLDSGGDAKNTEHSGDEDKVLEKSSVYCNDASQGEG